MELLAVIVAGRPEYWKGTTVDPVSPQDRLLASGEALEGVAKTCSGIGWPVASRADIEAFEAAEAALGRRLRWWILSRTHCVVLTWDAANPGYETSYVFPEDEPAWAGEVRRRFCPEMPKPGPYSDT